MTGAPTERDRTMAEFGHRDRDLPADVCAITRPENMPPSGQPLRTMRRTLGRAGLLLRTNYVGIVRK